jgi:hypothetical protein
MKLTPRLTQLKAATPSKKKKKEGVKAYNVGYIREGNIKH